MDERKNKLGQQLIDAAKKGDLSELESLIAQGADVNHPDTTKWVSIFPLWCDFYQYITVFSCVM
jgi:hypothetical protein